MKVELFKREDKKQWKTLENTGKFEMIKESPFSAVGEEYISCLKSCSLLRCQS